MSASTNTTSARNTVQQAFDDLKNIVSSGDSRDFDSTTLHDVRRAARDIERQLASRQKSSNMRRLEPLFDGLDHYSKAIEVVCNGTPYLPWIWAPMKLILQVSSEYIDAFRTLIDAYAQIADNLPRFSSLSESLKANPGFQETLAVFYADILRFHEEAYRLIRRSGWRIFFNTTWGRFRRRFQGIISDLKKHADLVDKEANAYNIHAAHVWRQEARQWRDENLREVARREKEESVAQFQAVQSWLDVRGTEQDDIFDNHCNAADQYEGTYQPFIWVKGKPGAGKSVLLTKLVGFLAQDSHSIVIHHFCSYMHPESTQYGTILRSLIAQILRRNDYLLAHIYEEYLLCRRSASPQLLEQLLPTLLSSISNQSSRTLYVRIVLDGLDECDEDKQQRVFTVLDRMVASTASSTQTICKVLLSSQDSPKLSRLLRRKASVSLYDESTALMSAIGVYVRQRLDQMRDDVFPIEHTDADVEEIAETIASNADGMFLWARLVLDVIQVGIFFSAEEMRTSAIKSIPKNLGQFYQRILDRIVTRFGGQSPERMRAVWSWIALAERPLRRSELKSALMFGSLDVPGAQLPPDQIFELYKPLIEERKDSTFSFIHVSVKQCVVFLEPLLKISSGSKETFVPQHIPVDLMAAIAPRLALEMTRRELNMRNPILRSSDAPFPAVGPRTLRKSKARSKLRAEPSGAGEAYSSRLAIDEPYTSTKPVLCTVWEKCMSKLPGRGLEWIETGEGWCTAFATVAEDGSDLSEAQLVVEQVSPFDNTDFDGDDVEEDDILVDSHPRDRQDLRIVPNITPSSSTATALQWTDSVTGVELLVQFTTDRECNELCTVPDESTAECFANSTAEDD
ncbi:hypothetical protein B7463_g12396, partial [Scytalidium lignicola]